MNTPGFPLRKPQQGVFCALEAKPINSQCTVFILQLNNGQMGDHPDSIKKKLSNIIEN